MVLLSQTDHYFFLGIPRSFPDLTKPVSSLPSRCDLLYGSSTMLWHSTNDIKKINNHPLLFIKILLRKLQNQKELRDHLV